MKELSIFVDESGDFGAYEAHAPYYIVTLVFHDQAEDIAENINRLNEKIQYAGLSNHTVHTGPLIRRENEYSFLSLPERKRVFNFFYNFARTASITYHSIIVEKRMLVDGIDLIVQLTKKLSAFLNDNLYEFSQYNRIVVYYDYGQMELTKILVSVFNAILNNVEFKKAVLANYKLFQAADMLCTLELLALKAERNSLSKSELAFFTSTRDLYKSYLKAIHKKKF